MRQSNNSNRAVLKRIRTAIGMLAASALGQSLPAEIPTYDGKPFVPIVQSQVPLIDIGFTTDFVRAELSSAGLNIFSLDAQGEPRVIIGSAGGSPELLTRLPLNISGEDSQLQRITNPGSTRGLAPSVPFVATSDDGRPFLASIREGRIQIHVSPESLVPGSASLHFDELANPILANGKIAFYGLARPPQSEPVSGIYLIQDGQITTTIDSRILEVAKEQFDFDGDQIVFVAGNSQGMLYSYNQSHGIHPFASDVPQDEALPQRVIDWIGVPSLSGRHLVVAARLEDGRSVLLQYTDRIPRVLLESPTPLRSGELLTEINYDSPVFREGRTYMEAQTDLGATGIYVIEEGIVSKVIDSSEPLLGDQKPSAIELLDVEEDRIAVKASTQTIASIHATLPVPEFPLIFEFPQSPVIVSEGSPIEIFTNAIGSPPLQYHWQKDGSPISIQEEATLRIPRATASDSGTYHLTVSNAQGSDSVAVQVSIAMAPVFGSPPPAQFLYVGDSLLLSLETAGSPPLEFQWLKDGVEIANQTSPLLWIPDVALSDNGDYQLQTSNSFGRELSSPIEVKVRPIPPAPLFEGGLFTPILVSGSPSPFDVNEGELLSFQLYPGGDFVMASTRYSGAPKRDKILKINALGTTDFIGDNTQLSELFNQEFDDLRNLRFDGATGTVTTTATVEGVPVGIYRFNGDGIESLVIPNSPVPDEPLQSYRNFRTEHSSYGTTIFSATLNRTDTRGIYRQEATSISILANESTRLPGGFGQGERVHFLASNGFEHLFQKTLPSVPNDFGLFLHKSSQIELLLRRGESLPGLESRFLQCLAAEATNARFFLVLQDEQFRSNLYTLQSSGFHRVAAPGDLASDGSQIVTIAPARPHFEEGRLYFQATVTTSDTDSESSNREAILFWDGKSVRTAMNAERLLGQLITNLELNHVHGNTIFFTAHLQRQGPTLFANPHSTKISRPQLSYDPSATGIRFQVPEGYQLEGQTAPGKADWYPIAGAEQVDVGIDDSQAIFRLRKR